MPGVSRSGITITTSRFLGLTRDAAARFSFLMLIPIVLGAVLYTGLKHVVLNPLPAGSTGPFVVGTIASAGAGLIAIDALLGYVRRHDYSLFVIYRIALAIVIFAIIASGRAARTLARRCRVCSAPAATPGQTRVTVGECQRDPRAGSTSRARRAAPVPASLPPTISRWLIGDARWPSCPTGRASGHHA
jgi:hypothetical protein